MSPTRIKDFDHQFPTREIAVRVPGTRTAFVKYEKLRERYPFLTDELHYTDAQIDQWLERELGYVGSEQSKLNGIRNTPIPTDLKSSDALRTKIALRPPGANRSAVLELHHPVRTDEVIDVLYLKGFGNGVPTAEGVQAQVKEFVSVKQDPEKLKAFRNQNHVNGLATDAEGGAEVSRQSAVQAILDRSYLPLETNEVLALLAYPFQVIEEHGNSGAMLIVSTANLGRTHNFPVPPSIYVDLPGGLQQTSFGTGIDFGGSAITDPRLAETFSPGAHLGDPTLHQPLRDARKAGESFRAGDPHAFQDYLDKMLAPLHNFPLTAEEESNHVKRVAYQTAMRKEAVRLNRLPILERSAALKEFQNEQPYVRSAWEKALLDPSVSNYVEGILKRKDNSPFMIAKAIESKNTRYAVMGSQTLIGRTDAETLPILEKALQSSDRMIRNSAAQALLRRPDLTKSLLLESFRSPDENVRRFAAEAAIGRSEISKEELEPLLEDRFLPVRENAKRALQRLTVASVKAIHECNVLEKVTPMPESLDSAILPHP